MQKLADLVVAQRALRQRVCTQCSDRPPGSEAMPPTEARSCEPQCPVFVNLPALHHIAATTAGETLGPYEHAIRETVCQNCESTPTAGDYCGDRTTRACPLSRYTGLIVQTLERL